MGWVVLALRKAQLKAKINDNNLAQLQLNRELQNLTSFSTAIADGYITPSEIASIGTSLFGDAMDFMYNSTYSADAVAQEQTSYYTDLDNYNARVDAFNACADTVGCFQSEAVFNRQYNALNTEVEQLESRRTALNEKIADYNEKLVEYNEAVEILAGLYNRLNSNSAPTEGVVEEI